MKEFLKKKGGPGLLIIGILTSIIASLFKEPVTIVMTLGFLVALVGLFLSLFFAKENSLLKTLASLAGLLVVYSWIIPASYYSGSDVVGLGLMRVGIFDLLNYPFIAIQYFVQLLLFILVVGGLYGVLSKIGKYRNALEKIAKSLKGNETVFLIIFALILAVLSSIFGLTALLFIFIPALCGIILLMGYDKLTALLVTFVAPIIGVIGSTYSTYVNGYINEILKTTYSTDFITKATIFIVSFLIYAIFTVKHANKYMASKKEQINDADTITEFIGEKKQVKKPTWPLIVIFGIMFVVLILATTPWVNVFEVNIFTELHTTLTTWTIKDLPILSYLLGDIKEFGNWYLMEMTMIVALTAFVIGFVYKLKLKDIVSSFGKGTAKLLKPAFIVMFSMIIVIITAYHPFYMTLTDSIINISENFNIFLTTIVTMLGSLLNIEMIYLAQSSLPYIAGTFVSEASINSLAIISQSMYGITMLVAPTSTMLILGLTFLDIPYKNWLKNSWKMLLSILAAILIIILIGAL